MTDRDLERLSALMDGEAAEHEVHQALKALEEDPSLADTWKRYHIAQSALRREAGSWSGVDLRASLAAKVAAEAAPARPVTASRRRLGLQALASVAVAASVALVTVFSWQSLHPATPATGAAIAGSNGSGAGVQTVALGPQIVVREDGEELVMPANGDAPTAGQDRLNAYLAGHARASGSLASARVMTAYARVVSVDGEQGR